MTTLPPQLLVEAQLPSHALADPRARPGPARLGARLDSAWAGRRVAVAAGSRGIDRYAEVVAAVVASLAAGGSPSLRDAGHGQPRGRHRHPARSRCSRRLGITEATVGAPIVSNVETGRAGGTAHGFRVLTAKDALEADAVVLVNRVKPHTDFASPRPSGSGLQKMCAIGLGQDRRRLRVPPGGLPPRPRDGDPRSRARRDRPAVRSFWGWPSSRTATISWRASRCSRGRSSEPASRRSCARPASGCRPCPSRRSTCSSSTRSART